MHIIILSYVNRFIPPVIEYNWLLSSQIMLIGKIMHKGRVLENKRITLSDETIKSLLELCSDEHKSSSPAIRLGDGARVAVELLETRIEISSKTRERLSLLVHSGIFGLSTEVVEEAVKLLFEQNREKLMNKIDNL